MSVIDIIRVAAIGLSILVVILGIFLLMPGSNGLLERVFKSDDLAPVDFSSLERTGKPNDYLVCPEGICQTAKPDMTAPTYDLSAEALRAQVLGIADSSPNIAMRDLDMENNQVTFVERTPTMRFPDIITVRIFPLEGQRSTLAIYSRSVYGYSDMGVNEKRVKRWLAILTPTP